MKKKAWLLGFLGAGVLSLALAQSAGAGFIQGTRVRTDCSSLFHVAASDAGSKFKFEYFTDDFTHDSAASVHFSPTFGRFDSVTVSWDSVSLGREEYPESEPKTFDQPY